MVGRKWHLEHADGREWTKAELDQLATDWFEAPNRCIKVLLDEKLRPWMLFGPGSYGLIEEEGDAVVVWDD